jgi:hypothetical protein
MFFVSYPYESRYLQELQKTEAAHTAAEAQTSNDKAAAPKAPSGGAEAKKTRGAASTPINPKV